MLHSVEIKVAPVHFGELGLYLHVDVSAELYVKTTNGGWLTQNGLFRTFFKPCGPLLILSGVCVCVSLFEFVTQWGPGCVLQYQSEDILAGPHRKLFEIRGHRNTFVIVKEMRKNWIFFLCLFARPPTPVVVNMVADVRKQFMGF